MEGVGDWRPFVILPLNALLAAVPPNCCMNVATSGSCSLTLRRCFVRWINETGLRIVKSRGNLRGGEPHFLSVLRFGGLVFIGDRAGMGEVCERDIVVNQERNRGGGGKEQRMKLYNLFTTGSVVQLHVAWILSRLCITGGESRFNRPIEDLELEVELNPVFIDLE